MKKFRGQKKYYKRLEIENDLDKANWLDFSDPEIWLDNWHLHFDWKGLGNNSFKKRKPHLDKLIRHFELLEEETKKLNKDFQLYAVLLDNDSYYDALFVNTSNPNNKFPWKYDNLIAKSNLTNSDLERYVNNLEGFEKYYGIADENFCVLYKKGIGIEPK
ncbi:hypothetical protein ACJRPK_09545 [Aquimarina sp. 2-A2]|uniref:hypothetical protein n=1 Tax=Aquimarina sp. 2-A2 TaxID=3382644 RepID=UPI00387EFC66